MTLAEGRSNFQRGVLARFLADGAGSWLNFEASCDRAGLFSEKYHCCPVNKAVVSMAYIMLPIGICTPDFKLMFSSMVCKRPASPALFRPLLMPRLSTLRSA